MIIDHKRPDDVAWRIYEMTGCTLFFLILREPVLGPFLGDELSMRVDRWLVEPLYSTSSRRLYFKIQFLKALAHARADVP